MFAIKTGIHSGTGMNIGILARNSIYVHTSAMCMYVCQYCYTNCYWYPVPMLIIRSSTGIHTSTVCISVLVSIPVLVCMYAYLYCQGSSIDDGTGMYNGTAYKYWKRYQKWHWREYVLVMIPVLVLDTITGMYTSTDMYTRTGVYTSTGVYTNIAPSSISICRSPPVPVSVSNPDQIHIHI